MSMADAHMSTVSSTQTTACNARQSFVIVMRYPPTHELSPKPDTRSWRVMAACLTGSKGMFLSPLIGPEPSSSSLLSL